MGYSFDGATKVITLTAGTTTMSVRDVWSRWVDWWLTSDNSKYQVAFTTVGGNDVDVSAGTSIPIYAFLMNGWRIKPQESSHTLTVTDGILLVDGGGDPFNSTIGAYVVQINYQQPVQAITVNTAGGTTDPWTTVLEGSLTTADALRLILSVCTGKTNKSGSLVTFRDYLDTKNRVEATLDGLGSRTAVTTDPT